MPQSQERNLALSGGSADLLFKVCGSSNSQRGDGRIASGAGGWKPSGSGKASFTALSWDVDSLTSHGANNSGSSLTHFAA